MAATVEELPEELMTLILLKLPVKYLLRFKCVQKSWYSLIISPQFVRLHHRSSSCSTNSSINYDCFHVRHFHHYRPVLSLYSYETLDDLGSQISIHFSFVGDLELCDSCDGLVCLSSYNDLVLICNPTTREFRSLFVPLPLCRESGYYIKSVAFGSDPNMGQYKVVMIGEPIPFGDCEARLYNFSTDSCRDTAATAAAFPPSPFHYSYPAISLNGAFHWCPRDHDSNNILTFHISNEVTGLISLPEFVFDFYHEMQLFVSSKSQLSLIVYDCDGRFEICVMTEYGVNQSWTRLFRIGPLLNIFGPIPFWDEQRLLLRNVEGRLVSCDLQHQNLRHFPIHGDFSVFSKFNFGQWDQTTDYLNFTFMVFHIVNQARVIVLL